MGGFYDSIHVRTESYNLIKDILAELAKSKGHKFYLAPVINGWVSLFPNNYWQESIACEISKQIEADVLQMMVYDDDIFRYLYYRRGELIDEYNSCPYYFGEKVSYKEKIRLKGNPKLFLDIVGTESKVKKLRQILKPKSIFDKIKISKEAKQQLKEIESSSEELKNMINAKNEFLKFLDNNPELYTNEMKSLAKEAAAQGLKSKEELQKFLLENEKAQQFNIKIVKEYIKSRMSSKEFDFLRLDSAKFNKVFADIEKQISNQMSVDDKGDIKAPEGLFASETMLEFAEVLSIPNVHTSYEYLKAGNIDGVKEWERFVEIS